MQFNSLIITDRFSTLMGVPIRSAATAVSKSLQTGLVPHRSSVEDTVVYREFQESVK